MTISFPLSIPTIKGPNSVIMFARSNVGRTQSIFTFQQRKVIHVGQRWELTATFPPMKPEDGADEWIAFLLSLNGSEGSFLMGDPVRSSPRGSAATTPGSPLSMGADQTGQDIVIDGCPTSVNGYLLAGDFVQFGTGANTTLYRTLTDTNTNGSGEATLTLWPNRQQVLSDNTAMVVNNTKGHFQLSNNVSDWSITLPNYHILNFDAIEVIV